MAAVPPAPTAVQDVEPGQGRLTGAEVAVEVGDAVARVRARYRLEGRVPLELRTLRSPGQRVAELAAESGVLPGGVEGTPGSLPWGVERAAGLLRLRFEAPTDSAGLAWYRHRNRVPPEPGPPAWELRLSYRVDGDPSRIPLFVPATPTDVDSRLEIRIRGLDPEADLERAFPRFEWAGEGEGPEGGAVAVARPPNLPTFAVLPARTTLLTLNEAADLLVVVVLVGATGGWLLWRRREARRLRTGRDGRRIRSEPDPRGAGEP